MSAEMIVPEGWIDTKFTDFLDVQGGTQPPKSNFIYEPTEGYIRLLQIRDFGEKPVPTYIPEKKTLKTCQMDDVLIGRYGASLGRICSGMTGAYNVALAKVIAPSCFPLRYLKHYLNSSLFQLPLALLSRSAQNGFNKEDLATFPFPIPPLAEQHQIAQRLDELLAQVDTIKARLDSITPILKRFRQSVLSAAVSGKLTEEWRGKEKNSWVSVTLLDVVNEKPRNGYSPKGVDYVTPVKNLTLSATTQGFFVEKHFKYIDEAISSDSHLWLNDGDILIQRANSFEYVGVSAIYKGMSKEYIYPDLMMKVRPKNGVILGKYLHYSLLSEPVRKYFRDNATGTTGNMPKINQSTVSNAPILLPSLEEQDEIVRRVEQYLSFAEQIEQRVNDAKARVDKLTQSILAKAFRGELTADWRAEHPELISGENSAEALLAKIQAAKAALDGKKKKGKAA